MRLIDDTLFQSRMNLWDPESSDQNALLVEQQNSAKKYSYIRVILFWCLIFITLFLLSTLMTVIYGRIRYGELGTIHKLRRKILPIFDPPLPFVGKFTT